MLKVAIIGLGKIGLEYDLKKPSFYYHSHLKSLSCHKSFDIRALIDKNKNILSLKILDTFNTYKNLDYLEELDLDMIVIAVPTKYHLSIFNDICKKLKKVKYILFEKPVGQNLSECEKIIKLSRKKKIKIYVNYIRNYQKNIINFFIRQGNINLNKINITKIFYTGSIINNCSHFISLIIKVYGESNIKNISIIKKKYSKPINFYFEIKKNIFVFKFVEKKDKRVNTMKIINLENEIHLNSHNTFITIYNKKNKCIKKIKTEMEKYQLNVYDNIIRDITSSSDYVCDIKTAHQTHRIISRVLNA